eukprot:TRINITY_DN3841_c0_g3_i14.p1 TRINITY_DN3841_c0_g3~~TRINITY_DN3841_c0_g3_i14.p1  ORF type:complete len:178 (+),score=29.42 TRINITY_DN3841_c0_g3_i14:374-907(+)
MTNAFKSSNKNFLLTIDSYKSFGTDSTPKSLNNNKRFGVNKPTKENGARPTTSMKVNQKPLNKTKFAGVKSTLQTRKEKKTVSIVEDITIEQERYLDTFISLDKKFFDSNLELLRGEVKLSDTVNFCEPIDESDNEELNDTSRGEVKAAESGKKSVFGKVVKSTRNGYLHRKSLSIL